MQITLQHIHVTFEGKAKWFYWKIFCKEPPRVNQILHQVQSHMYTQKIATIFDHIKSHNGQALNHRRLIRPEKKSGRILCVRQVYFTVFYKILPTNLGEWKPTFLPFVHHIWGETVLWGTVFIIQTSDRMQYFTILQYKLHSFNIQDDRSTPGLLAKPLK